MRKGTQALLRLGAFLFSIKIGAVVVGSGVLDGPELPKAIKTIAAVRLGPSGRPVPTGGTDCAGGGGNG